jgi:hypothetical protein
MLNIVPRRLSLKERRELKKLSKKPRTRPVPHPFELPNLRTGK